MAPRHLAESRLAEHPLEPNFWSRFTLRLTSAFLLVDFWSRDFSQPISGLEIWHKII